jgi:hypothetical protein
MKTMNVLREGLLVGVVGAAALALWFLIVDAANGQPLHTPAALGAGLFRGERAVEALTMPAGAGGLIVGYTSFHVAVFVVAGIILSAIMDVLEAEPAIFLLAFFGLLVFFEFSYYVFVLVFVQRVMQEISWPVLLIGNAIAVAAMGLLLWQRHPKLHFKFEPKLDS